METVLRITAIYFFIMIGLRAMGKREFSQLSSFDLVVLLLIPEMAQQAMMQEDFSLTNAFIALSTLFTLVYLTSLLNYRSKTAEELIEGRPTVLVSNSEFVVDNLDRERITAEDVYSEMRKAGLSRLEQVRWAILEPDGKMSLIPYSDANGEVIRSGGQRAVE